MTKIFDCSIRDGGHLTNWHFDEQFVKSLYKAATLSGIDYFEVGYRNLPNDKGEYATCSDDFLFSIFEDTPCKLSVMIDTGKSDLKLFNYCKENNTPISLVRVATYPELLEQSFELCEGLKDKGYSVILNFMAFGKYTENDYNKLLNWQGKNILDAVCFADSFGAFYPNEISKYFNTLKNIGFNNIGFHAHNNLQLAFANSLKAIENNAYSLDSAIGGFGRSAGILPTELILSHLQKIGIKNYSPIPYYDLIRKNPNLFKIDNLKSLIGGINNIHPNYIEDLFRSENNSQILCEKILEISNINKISYK